MVEGNIKKKRVSKRNKIAWRKHTKVKDVEDFLEDQRLEERLGLPEISDKDLFILDKQPTNEVKELSKKEKSKLKLSNPKCFQMLKPHTNVPDPIAKRNRVRTKEERMSKLVIQNEEKRKAAGILKAKEIDSIKGKEFYEKQKLSKPKRGDFTKDVWDVQETSKNEWIDDDATSHNLWKTGAYVKKVVPSVQKKTSVLPSVEPPHPGTSYNPSFEDHQDLLRKVAEKEQELMKRDDHLNRVTRFILRKVSATKNMKVWMEEMSQGLPIQNVDDKNKKNNDDDDDDDGQEYSSINPPVKNRKKTLQQRRKHKEHLKAEQLRKLAKVEKKKVSDLHRLRVLKEQVKFVDQKILLNMANREKSAKERKKQPKRLGRKKFEENDLEFNMPGDIAGNLRKLKKESSVLVDRFVSLQKRNLIAPSCIVHNKKPKLKRYVRAGHKDDWKITVAGIQSK